ncbi:Acyl carrier protein [Lactococcus lactis subsp. lactis NCDO 2118]|uniref:Acyl carrier protein n=1 Tax=Lactococcus lactis subsp. lactis NCDO 2118 TaxID=1117941 RepID=A0ABC8A5U3_LACLL|nr:acyl carrier protein [Lactococcus lactis]ADA64977.1 Acyl carrier protein [Lactococcus lactis subsp. lactis KF147]AII12742.1 Acyl carrier protein [Lactococcus lactis subsp. lactis NCDO 2118]
MENLEAIKEIVARLSPLSVSEIKDNDKLADIGVDSLSTVEIIVGLEEKFNLEFEDSTLDLGKLSSIQGILKLVNETLG